MTIELSDEGMRIVMPEQDRVDFINHAAGMFAQAVVFTEQCIDILVEDYGADRNNIAALSFYESYVGKQIENQISGKPLPTPSDSVARAINQIWPELLGLASPGRWADTIERSRAEYAKIATGMKNVPNESPRGAASGLA